MMEPQTFIAGSSEEGQLCACCREALRSGQEAVRCPKCGRVAHQACWARAGCCAYECRPQAVPQPERDQPNLVVTHEETAKVRVLTPGAGPLMQDAPPRKRSKLAVAAFVCALLGIFTGLPALPAIALGGLAIGWINAHRGLKGTGFAAAAIILGTLSVVVWTAGLTLVLVVLPRFRRPELPVVPGPAPWAGSMRALDVGAAPAPVRRGIRANVFVVALHGAGESEGSGVILEVRAGEALILTNLHVITGGSTSPDAARRAGEIEVTFADGSKSAAAVEWCAPGGVDAAVISCPLSPFAAAKVEVARVRGGELPAVAEKVFAIGNPFGLGWSYSEGVVSAIRVHRYSGRLVRMIQIQVPLNPGNSGGGLYDRQGALVGLNTWTADKFAAEGISFAIALADLAPLLEAEAGVKIEKVEGAPRLDPAQGAGGTSARLGPRR